MAGRTKDQNGYSLLLGDSHASSQNFGFDGNGLRNVPKSKFMFYVKFHRARSQGGSAWERGMAFTLKSLDRPRISFSTEILNQYNRKRIVQTNTEYESMIFKFHDTVLEEVQRMFEEYYDYYFNDLTAYVDPVKYDVVRDEMDSANPFGLKATSSNDGFFSHITIYQIFNKQISVFELINPKIQQFNPDDFDYSSSESSEIVMNLEFEGIVYKGIQELDEELAVEMGIDATQFYDVDDKNLGILTPGLKTSPIPGNIDNFDAVRGILGRQLRRGLAGEQVSLKTLGNDLLSSFDKNRGLATAKLGKNALGDLLKGNNGDSLKAVRKLILYGKPGKLF